MRVKHIRAAVQQWSETQNVGARSAKGQTARCQSVRLHLHRGVNVPLVSGETVVQTKTAIARCGVHGQRGGVARKTVAALQERSNIALKPTVLRCAPVVGLAWR